MYVFERSQDLWLGVGRNMWDEAIYPALDDIQNRHAIARREFVAKKAKVAFQLAPSRNTQDFHFNLRDIDAVYDRGPHDSRRI